jgi:transcription elongation factor Elf1
MSFINCIVCGGDASVIGKPNHVVRKIRCKICGVVESSNKKLKQPEILVISSAKNQVMEEDNY